jgi:hypothetical protein
MIREIPTMFPLPSRTGDSVIHTSIAVPSLAWRLVAEWTTCSPAATREVRSCSSSRISSGMIRSIEHPRMSPRGQPKMRSAEAFQLVIVPSSVVPMIASSESPTIAERSSRRSVMSSEKMQSPCAIGTKRSWNTMRPPPSNSKTFSISWWTRSRRQRVSCTNIGVCSIPG